jgi:hypothetical protein
LVALKIVVILILEVVILILEVVIIFVKIIIVVVDVVVAPDWSHLRLLEARDTIVDINLSIILVVGR